MPTCKVTDEAEFDGISNQNGYAFSPNFFRKRSCSLVYDRVISSFGGYT